MRLLSPVKAPVCGVFAATLACALPFDEVMAKARKIKKNNGGWKGRLYSSELLALLCEVGAKFSGMEGFKRMTLAAAAKELDPAQRYIIFVTGHYLTLHQGKAYDQAHVEGEPVGTHYCQRRRIRIVLKLH